MPSRETKSTKLGGELSEQRTRNIRSRRDALYSRQLQAVYSDKFALPPAPARRLPDNVRLPFSSILTKERLKKIKNIAGCPVAFQQYIEKALELRITVVKDSIFAAEIHSQELVETQTDFRHMSFDTGHTVIPTHKATTLPNDVATKLMMLMKQLDLVFGCIDMILTPDGEYVFLEVNPSGQWNWVEKLTGMKITEALVDALLNPPVPPSPLRSARP